MFRGIVLQFGMCKVYNVHMKFEFDPSKSESNRDKHGIDFTQAQRLWEDPDRLVVPARTP